MNLKFKGLLGVLLALALSFAVTPAFAATTKTATKGAEVKKVVQTAKVDIEALKTDVKNKGQQVREIEAKKAASLKKIDNSKKDAKRIGVEQSALNYINDARNRLTKAVTDLDTVATQLDSRITSLKATGKDTTAAENALALARANIQVAKDHITAFTNTQNQAVNAEKLSDGIVIVGTALTDIEASLKTARQSLMDVVTAIKTVAPVANPTAPVTGATAPATR